MQSLRKYKRLGQHFLTDQSVIQRIVAGLAIQPNQHIIEIGAGDGALTQHLLQTGARVTALEFDHRRIPVLRRRLGHYQNLRLLEGDALHIEMDQLLASNQDVIIVDDEHKQQPQNPAIMVGNLPYNIASQILLRFVTCEGLSALVCMLQREVALRLVANCGTSDYGRLTLAVRLWRDTQLLFDIAPAAFDPSPRVVSSMVCLGGLRPMCKDQKTLLAFDVLVRAAFMQRRKQLGNSLAGLVTKEQFAAQAIDPTRRAADLHIEEFLRLAKARMA